MFEVVKKLINHDQLKAEMPINDEIRKKKLICDNQIKDIISGKDKRKMFLIGPCSADNEQAVVDYAVRLARLAEKVSEKLLIIPRIYTNKPRTRGEGYKGMLHSPDPTKGTDIQSGIRSIRHMHLKVISESGLFGADEMLYPDNYLYLNDVLSYVTIGARSVENQEHRLVASGIDVPVGVKNPMNGSMPVLLNSIHAVQIPNEFKFNKNQVRTNGNEFAHAILRGSVDIFGNNLPNYHYEDIIKYYNMSLSENVKNQSAIIDANHSNSNKCAPEQLRIVYEIIANMKISEQVNDLVKGFMVESYIEEGNQSPQGGVYGKSITDACIGWENTEKLIMETADKI